MITLSSQVIKPPRVRPSLWIGLCGAGAEIFLLSSSNVTGGTANLLIDP